MNTLYTIALFALLLFLAVMYFAYRIKKSWIKRYREANFSGKKRMLLKVKADSRAADWYYYSRRDCDFPGGF